MKGSTGLAAPPHTSSHARLIPSVMPKESGRCPSCGKPYDAIKCATHPGYCDAICWNTRADTLDKNISRRWPKALKPKFMEQYGDNDEVQLYQKLNEKCRRKISNLCRTHLGLKLEQQRLRHNFTLLNWQHHISINQEPYQKILKGEKNVTGHTLKKALDACEIEETAERDELTKEFQMGDGLL
jgi:hypothetical protein